MATDIFTPLVLLIYLTQDFVSFRPRDANHSAFHHANFDRMYEIPANLCSEVEFGVTGSHDVHS